MSDELRELVAALGGPAAASATVVGQREGKGGVEALAGKGQQELALLDRYSHGALARDQMGRALALLGVPAAAAYEGVKAVEQSPFRNWMSRTLLDLSGGSVNETTSPASFDNVTAYLEGINANPEELRAPAPPMYAGQKRRP